MQIIHTMYTDNCPEIVSKHSHYFSSIEINVVQYKTVSRNGIGMVFIWYKFKHEGMKVSLLI